MTDTGRRRRASLMAIALLGVWFAAVAPSASARAYTSWSCRTGSNTSTEGLPDWVHSSYGVGGYSYNPGVVCQTDVFSRAGEPFNTAVFADLSNNPGLVVDDMSVAAPAGLTFGMARLWWRGQARSSGQVAAIATRQDGTQATLIDRRNVSFPTAGDPDQGGAPIDTIDLGGATGLTLRSACLASCQADPSTDSLAEWRTYRVALSVNDPFAPSGTATGGLLGDPVLAGQRAVTVDGTDQGGGVYLARVLVDGQVRASTPFAEQPCRDVDEGNADPFEFARIRPCPGAGTATVTLDTTALGEDLRHDIQVQVVDAAGNATVIAQRTAGVDNNPPAQGFFNRTTRRFENPQLDLAAARRLNGSGATPDARLRVYLPVTRSVRIKHGKRAGQRRRTTRGMSKRTVAFRSRATLRGVLTDASRKPISGAVLWLATRTRGSEWAITGGPYVTSKTGRIGMRLPARTPSRDVNLVYFPFSDSHEQAVGQPVTLAVRAGVHLSVSRTTVRNGQRVRFAGRVEGLRPGRDAIGSLQAVVRGRYRTFRQVRLRASASGRFTTPYRFTDTSRSTRYRFRLVVVAQAGLPYARGVSPVRTVLVVP